MIKKYSLIFSFVLVIVILNILFTVKAKDYNCDMMQCFAPHSNDAGFFGVVYRAKLDVKHLQGVKYITVKNASFFRVFYSGDEVSRWYYGPSYASLHSTKLHKIFYLRDKHELRKTSFVEPIEIEINVVTNYRGCNEILLIRDESAVDRQCVQPPHKLGSYMFVAVYLLLPTFFILVLLGLRNKRHGFEK